MSPSVWRTPGRRNPAWNLVQVRPLGLEHHGQTDIDFRRSHYKAKAILASNLDPLLTRPSPPGARYTVAADKKRLAIEGMRLIEKRTGCGNPGEKVSNRHD